MLVDLTPTWPIVIPQPPEARVWCRRPLIVEVLVIAGVVAALAILGLVLWPLSGSIAEPWRIVVVELVVAAVLIAIAGRFLVPRRSAFILTEDGILRRDDFSLFGILRWSEDNWLAAWDDVLSYQVRRDPESAQRSPAEAPDLSVTAEPHAPARVRVTFQVLGRHGSRPVHVLCSGSAQQLARLHEVLQGQVAREDAGLLEAYRLKRPGRARRWDALLVAACLGVAMFPDLAIQACLTACGSSVVMEAPPLNALPVWRYMLGGIILVLGVALTTRVPHAISPALALAAFFVTIPAALIPVDEPAVRAFFGGYLSPGATLGVAFVVLLKLGVIAAMTATWREYVTRGVHDGTSRKRPSPAPPARRARGGGGRKGGGG
ncbi:MAG: hypothetical protein PVH68_16445 [Armatimonadota bacterium]|jgi:hypothetical protein